MYPISNLRASHGPAALPAGKKGGTQRTEGWREGGDLSGRLRKISIPPRFKSRTVQPTDHPKSEDTVKKWIRISRANRRHLEYTANSEFSILGLPCFCPKAWKYSPYIHVWRNSHSSGHYLNICALAVCDTVPCILVPNGRIVIISYSALTKEEVRSACLAYYTVS